MSEQLLGVKREAKTCLKHVVLRKCLRFLGLALSCNCLIQRGTFGLAGLQLALGRHEADFGLIAQALEAFRRHFQQVLFQSSNFRPQAGDGDIEERAFWDSRFLLHGLGLVPWFGWGFDGRRRRGLCLPKLPEHSRRASQREPHPRQSGLEFRVLKRQCLQSLSILT